MMPPPGDPSLLVWMIMTMRLRPPHQILRPKGPSLVHGVGLHHSAARLSPQDLDFQREVPELLGQEIYLVHPSLIYLSYLRKRVRYWLASRVVHLDLLWQRTIDSCLLTLRSSLKMRDCNVGYRS